MSMAYAAPDADVPGAIVALGYAESAIEVTAHTRTGALLNAARRPPIERLAQRPRPPRAATRRFLNRRDELEELLAEALSGQGAWLHGPRGCGLSALLHQAAKHAAQALPDGVVYIEGEVDLPQASLAQQIDLFRGYERGLYELLQRLGPGHQRYTDALLLQSRLLENIHAAQQFGDPEASKAERARVIDQLNRLTLEALNLPFADLGVSTVGLAASHYSRLNDVIQELFNRFYTSDTAVRVSPGLAKTFLGGLKGLFVFDCPPLTYQELVTLIGILADGAVLVAADGPAPDMLLDVSLKGIPRREAIQLCAAEAALDGEDSYAANLLNRLCDLLDDLPLSLRLAGRLIREQALALEELVAKLEDLVRQETGIERAIGPPGGAAGRPAARAGSSDDRGSLARVARLCIDALNHNERATLAAVVRAAAPDADTAALMATSQLAFDAAKTALERLIQLGLVRSGGGRYTITSQSLRRMLDRLLPPDAERGRAADFYSIVAEQHHGDLEWIEAERGNLIAAAETSLAAGQADKAGALAQTVEPALVLGGRWDNWVRVIDLASQAAQVAGNPALEAWALHERGTYAALMGDYAAATADLDEAYRLRRSLDDHVGAAASQHNKAHVERLARAGLLVSLAAIGRSALKRVTSVSMVSIWRGSAWTLAITLVAWLLFSGTAFTAFRQVVQLIGSQPTSAAIVVFASPLPTDTPPQAPTEPPAATSTDVPTAAPSAAAPANTPPPSTDTPPPPPTKAPVVPPPPPPTDTPMPPSPTAPLPPTDTPMPPSPTAPPPTDTPTNTPSPSPTDTPTDTPTNTPSPSPTDTPTATVVPSPEDCLPYDPAKLRIVDEGASGWLLTDDVSRMVILDNEQDARNALALAQRHTAQCFIGRDNQRPNRKDYIVEYWTGSSGNTTTIAPEDCIGYNSGDLRIVDEGASGWLLTDGVSRMVILDNQHDAQAALLMARQYSQQCFIGRDNQRPNRQDYIVDYWQ